MMALLKCFWLKSQKQPLSDLNGALNVKNPSSGISSANACVSNLYSATASGDTDSGERLGTRVLYLLLHIATYT